MSHAAVRPAWCALALAGVLAGSALAQPDDVRDACDLVARQVSGFKGGLYRQAPDTFEDDGKIFRGCLVTVVGDHDKVPDGFPPAGRAYPDPGSPTARAGWKADRETDGPDGTSYRISRGRVFCVVRGSWDGGDASDRTVVPSPLFLITARCARLK